MLMEIWRSASGGQNAQPRERRAAQVRPATAVRGFTSGLESEFVSGAPIRDFSLTGLSSAQAKDRQTSLSCCSQYQKQITVPSPLSWVTRIVVSLSCSRT